MTNPDDPYTVVRDRGGKARHVRQEKLATVSDRTKRRAKLEESWRPTILALVMLNDKPRPHLAYVADLIRNQHRRGGRVVETFPSTWNVLATWPMQSVLIEAPFLCARVERKGILTNCADTARLIGRSRSCKSLSVQRLVQSSLANLFVSHEVCLGACQSRKIPCTAAILPTSKRRQPFRQRRTIRFASGDKIS